MVFRIANSNQTSLGTRFKSHTEKPAHISGDYAYYQSKARSHSNSKEYSISHNRDYRGN